MIVRSVAFFLLFTGNFIYGQSQNEKTRWVDSVYNSLNETERIGQLFIAPVSSDPDDNKVRGVEKDVESGFLGGVLFTSGDLLTQVSLTNEFQSKAKVPLIIAMDAANGLGPHLQNTLTFPNALAQGSIDSDSLIHAMAMEIGRELKLIGVNMNLAPVSNLAEKIDQGYNLDKYGEDRFMVTSRLTSYLHGMQSQNILSCAKYFPIQGITVKEIVNGVPITQAFVDSAQAHTFDQQFRRGIAAVMPAASEFPVFYENIKAARKYKFSSALLSSFFAGSWIRNNTRYKGLLIVDMRKIEASSAKIKGADAELLAFQAGNDLIITDNNPVAAIRKIRKVVRNNEAYASQLEQSVKRILSAKYDAGLSILKPVSTENLLLKLNNVQARLLQQRLFRSAVTIIKNSDYALPILALEDKQFTLVATGDTLGIGPLFRAMDKYVYSKKIIYREPSDSLRINAAIEGQSILVIVTTPQTPKEVVDELMRHVTKGDRRQIVVIDLGSSHFKSYASRFNTVVTAFDPHRETLVAIPQVIFGALPAKGILPVTVANQSPGTKISTQSLKRLSYSLPEDAGMSGKVLERIERIANEAITTGGTPGCHVLVARRGKVVYERSFGYLTYENQAPVTDSTIYDLASVTKVSATLQAIMFLYDRGMIDLNKKASVYLPELKNSNKENFIVKDILTHQAGLWPFIPFYVQTMKDTSYLPGFYARTPSVEYPNMVANNLFTFRAMPDSLWSWSIKGKVREKPDRTPYDYRYSDISFYIMHRLAIKLLNQPLEDFVQQNLYEPLGAHTTGYLPLLRFPASRIAPTENDKAFRKTLLVGTVHDPGAAMHGGVAGHAGLFSTANDLAKLGQMLLQEGYYGGYQYYRKETVRLFRDRPYQSNHRGLGWAKAVQSDYNTPTSIYSSPQTFGHTGYTGTCIWMDPEFDLLYIFLSNRVHPEVRTKLLTSNIRTRIHDVIYQSIFEYCKEEQQPPVVETTLTGPAQ